MLDQTTLKARQQQVWATGDYSRIATQMALMSELLCEAAGLCAGQRVLDVATGSGNTALAAARRSCLVTAIDYVPALLGRGRERASAERLEIDFREGDAEDIPYPAASFDVVLSTIGVMFASDQERSASELLRVCRPGGVIGLASWTPDGFVADLFALLASYNPPTPGVPSPLLWGTRARIEELFKDQVTSLHLTRRTFTFRSRSVENWLEYYLDYFGPTRRIFETLDPDKKQHFTSELLDLVRHYDRSCNQSMEVPGDYLEVVANKR